MEDEETEVRKLITRKTLGLLTNELTKIDIEQVKALEIEYKLLLKKDLAAEEADEEEKFSDFFYNVNMCLKMIKKCPTKELLDEIVREKVTEICPQVLFDQLFIDHAAKLFH